MAPKPDVEMPLDDPYALIGVHWPSESESAYHLAEVAADDASTAAQAHAESADDAKRQTDAGMQGRTATSVSEGYSSIAGQLHQQSADFTAISGWMLDAAGKVRAAKKHIANLVTTGTNEIRDAITSETAGTAVTPSSTDLTIQYRGDVASVASKLTTDLDDIGHPLQGAPGASTTPSYTSVPTTPTTERADPRAVVTAYNTGQHPAVEPHQLPEMPRATSTPSTPEAPSATSTPATSVSPHSPNPTLSNLVVGTPTAPSTSSAKPASTPSGTPAGKAAQAHQPTEQHQQIRPTGLPRIPSIELPDLPAAATDIATAVTSAAGHQLPTSTPPSVSGSSQAPASTGFTPGVSGTSPVTPTAPAGLSPVGGFPTTPVVQPTPTPQASPAAPTPGVQAPSAPQQSPSPSAPRGPVADMAWIQRNYGLSPSLDLPKSENSIAPVLFVASLPEPEAHLHRVLATIRHQFERSGWSQPMSVATIRRGLEARTVYVTADALSIHPAGVLLPHGVLPLDEMPGTPVAPELCGSLMVSDKLTSMIPREWDVEGVLSTVPGGEASQSAEQYQELVDAGELLNCSVSRGRDDVDADEALSVFARAALGSGGCGELDVEAARIRATRWVGIQPSGYLDVLSRWYLSDAAEAMSRGSWGEAVLACERYMSIQKSRSQAA